ncbi:serine/threonine-protein phosphatase pp2a-like ppg1 [Anaeramoeba flamelloides]|uniref:Serine/threonine-protein phosphatase n=1 Tax=Anaeramoeba flamelloides TaxID=1746091 RepID=A0AAV7ZC97_9EUKA|nr:serine/threonine-protein phosphatase pp2a-like ppg1 [Anaeramoeba flamelloides]
MKKTKNYKKLINILISSTQKNETSKKKVRQALPNINNAQLICKRVKKLFSQEPNIVFVRTPTNVIGDSHGQFFDLLQVFKEEAGINIKKCKNESFIFLGDYVDRGKWSLQLILFLFLLKILYPTNVTLIRGNHECRETTSLYRFSKDCKKFYPNTNAWEMFLDVFNTLPIACVIDSKYFCVHGGISQGLNTIQSIRELDRFKDIPKNGKFSELFWNDPNSEIDYFSNLSPRGSGMHYGKKAVKEFLTNNRIESIFRSHQEFEEGFNLPFENIKGLKYSVLTIWSMPNYGYINQNKGYYLKLSSDSDFNLKQLVEIKKSHDPGHEENNLEN